MKPSFLVVSCILKKIVCMLTLYLIETPFNTFASGADPNQAAA